MNRRAIERLAIGTEDSVLDIGFGGGVGLRHVLNGGAAFAAGIDISEAMLRQGRRRFRREIARGRVELKRGEVSTIPYEEGRFDGVFSANTIYFWPDPLAGLEEILRVLKPGGRLVLGTATIDAMQRRSFTCEGFGFFSEEDLAGLLRDAGFAEVAVDQVDDSVFSTGRKEAT
jgi:arsenite methyltransferase